MPVQEKKAPQATQAQADDSQTNLDKFVPIPLSATQTATMTIKILLIVGGLVMLLWLLTQS